jgi:hypothetical protein
MASIRVEAAEAEGSSGGGSALWLCTRAGMLGCLKAAHGHTHVWFTGRRLQ